jgi:hypothetical protein
MAEEKKDSGVAGKVLDLGEKVAGAVGSGSSKLGSILRFGIYATVIPLVLGGVAAVWLGKTGYNLGRMGYEYQVAQLAKSEAEIKKELEKQKEKQKQKLIAELSGLNPGYLEIISGIPGGDKIVSDAVLKNLGYLSPEERAAIINQQTEERKIQIEEQREGRRAGLELQKYQMYERMLEKLVTALNTQRNSPNNRL